MAGPRFFVMGAGRSGTSILQEILSLHPKLVVSHELRVLELALLAGALVDSSGVPPEMAPAQYTPSAIAFGRAFAAALGEAQCAAAGKTGADYGDKYPPYCEQFSVLHQLFPDARFVHILRDGRDVVASSIQAFIADRGWRRSPSVPSVASLAASWSTQIRFARGYAARIPTERYHELFYEDLVRRERPVLEDLLRFLGVEVDDSVEAMYARLRPGKSWRETMSHAELAEFEAISDARALLGELGYASSPLAPDDPNANPTAISWTRGVRAIAEWSRLAREARERGDSERALFASLRAVRGQEKSSDEARALLERSAGAESVFAALALRGDDAAPTRGALERWSVARGLDAEAARALFNGGGVGA